MDKPDVSIYVNSPNLLIDICKEVIKELEARSPKEKYTECQKQLDEISSATGKLEKAGVTIPNDLLNLKIALVEEIADYNETKLLLETLATGFKEILRDIYKSIEQKDIVDASNETPKYLYKQTISKSTRTSSKVLRQQIIKALSILGGLGTTQGVLGEMGRMLNGSLLPGDLETTEDGELVWHSYARWERFCMVNDGLLKEDSPWGVWELNKE